MRHARDARSAWSLLAAAPFVALGLVGLAHPHALTPETAGAWTTLHLVLLPVWPLMGAALWLLLRGRRGVAAGWARALAVVFGVYYGALDTINGVAAGRLVGGAPADAVAVVTAALPSMTVTGNTLAYVGTVAYLVAVLLTVTALWSRRHGRGFLGGAVLVVVGAVSFVDSHIYWPRGVLTMLVLAVGMALLARSTRPEGRNHSE